MNKIGEWLRNIRKWIEGALQGKPLEPVPVPVRR